MATKSGFLTRLSHLIVIQVLFIFSALALILFENNDIGISETNHIISMQEKYISLTQSISEVAEFVNNDQISSEYVFSEEAEYNLSVIFEKNQELQCAEIYVGGKDGETKRTYSANCFDFEEKEKPSELYGLLNNESLIKNKLFTKKSAGFFSNNYLVNYIPFELKDSTPALLVTVSSHDYLISSKSNLKYALMLLFLVATLINLLIVYLISKRLKAPLRQLMHGFQKTSQGEQYHIVEPQGDLELTELCEAFNKMSSDLWKNYQEMKSSNSKLESSNNLLAASQNTLSTLIDNTPDCILSTTPNEEILFCNSKAEKMFGYTVSEMNSMTLDDLFSQKGVFKEKCKEKIKEGSCSMELLAKQKDGELLPIYVTASPVYNEDKTIKSITFILRDISESKGYQETMIRLDRYYSRGEMMGQIAHDINNYLSVLSGNLELFPLFLKKGNEEKIYQKLEVMKNTVDKIIIFSNGLMEPNKEVATFVKTDTNQLVENMTAFLKPQKRFDDISVTTNLKLDLPHAYLDAGQIQQLLVNFIYNAADALAVHEDNNAKEISVVTLSSGEGDEEVIRVEVRDNGQGIPEDKRDRLFNKRFTTKKKGHGIGLLTCGKIIESHYGKIGYDFDNGSVFYFEIPLSQPDEAANQDEQNSSELSEKVIA